MKVKVYFGKTMYDVLGIGVEPIGGKPVPECNQRWVARGEMNNAS